MVKATESSPVEEVVYDNPFENYYTTGDGIHKDLARSDGDTKDSGTCSSTSTASPSVNSCSIGGKNSDPHPTLTGVDFGKIEIPQNFQSSCLDLLKCHNCPQIMYPPIYSCRKGGHAFCHLCMEGKGRRCRICKSAFSKTRNHYLESMASLLRLRCSYALCEDMISGQEIDTHKMVCQYRPVSCFETEVKKCKGQLINFEEYGAHLEQIHKCKVEELVPGQFTCLSFSFNSIVAEANRFPIRILKLENKIFTFQLRKYTGTEVCFVVLFVGGADEAKKYRCIIQLQKPRENFPTTIQWETAVHTIHMSLDSIHASGNLFVISEKTLVPFCTPTGFIETKNQKQQVVVGVHISTLN